MCSEKGALLWQPTCLSGHMHAVIYRPAQQYLVVDDVPGVRHKLAVLPGKGMIANLEREQTVTRGGM